MFGRKGHRIAAKTFLWFIFLLALPSFLVLIFSLLLPDVQLQIPAHIQQWSWPGWIFWFIVLVRFIRISHPATAFDHSLDRKRKTVGWLAIVIFLVSFTPVPFGLT